MVLVAERAAQRHHRLCRAPVRFRQLLLCIGPRDGQRRLLSSWISSCG